MSTSKVASMSDLPVRDPSISTIESDFRKSEGSEGSTVSTFYGDEDLPPLVRKKGLSAKSTFLNFMKGMIGPGCLSLPLALKEAGLWTGLFLIVFYGVLNTYCMLQLVHCSQYLSRKKGDASLDYGSLAYEASANSFTWIRRHKNLARIIVNTAIIALQVGICSVFYVFVAVHTQEIVEQYWHLGFSKQTYMLLVLLPFILVNFLRTLRIIAIISIIGNICMIVSLIFIFQHLIREHHLFGSLPWITDFNGIMTATGAILYSFEGQAMVLPMENKLKHPEKMVGPFGVLSCGMGVVTVIYSSCGFLGYITYGKSVEGSITLNLPESPEFTVVKALLVLVVFFGFVIQQYVIVEMTWPKIKTSVLSKSQFFTEFHISKSVIPELVYRSLLVVLAMGFAIAIPNLEQIIPLVGVTAGMMLAFVFPATLDSITFIPGMFRKLSKCHPEESKKQKLRICWRIFKNTCLVSLGIFGCIAGLQSSIRDLIEN